MTFQIRGIWVLILVALVVVAGMLFLKQCGRVAPEKVISKHQYDSVLQRTRETESKKFLDSVFYHDANEREKAKQDSLKKQITNLEGRIQSLIIDGNTYRKQLDHYASIKLDTGMIDVHPSYVDYCDSLADLSASWESNYKTYKTETGSLIYALNDQLSLKNQEIVTEKDFSKKVQDQNAWLTKGYNEIAKKYQPRNKMFFGAAIAGTQDTPLYGFGLGVAFMNKKEQLVNADALMIRGGALMFQVSGKFKISFR